MKTNERGGFAFLPGTSFLSFAAVAQPRFAIERAVFRRPRPLEAALEAIARHLEEAGRPLQALCGLEFRQFAPRQWSGEEFAGFNADYVRRLAASDLLVDGSVPIARTNVVVNVERSPQEGGVHAFSYTVPAQPETAARGFVFSAAPEVRFTAAGYDVIASGETSPAALERKMGYIMGAVNARLAELGLEWDDVTGTQLYCEQDLHPLLTRLILPGMGAGAWRGLHWIHALPPVGPAIFELDLRSVRADRMVA